MTDILADLAGYERTRGSHCILTKLRSEEPEMAAQFEVALEATQFSSETVARWWRDHGYKVSGQVIRNHRAGYCRSCQTAS